ncbi:MAG: molecular chaperone HtpG [Firmicutes bacterium]|nr:molecular chaperone HtpG [Bacillota bacterium]
MDEKIKKGGISVETEHIFPIIKKWLYSEKEIFLREIVSNACDAVTKLRRLISLGEVHDLPEDDFRITVKADKDERTITVSDNGIGMTREELEKYLCSIALSGALDFIQKYEGESEDAGNGIIGHFGLGFYSSFMVSETVDVITRSYAGGPATKWVCTENGEYTLEETEKETRGTDVVMHVSENETEFLEDAKLLEILRKYCAFMPVEIYFEGEKKEEHEHEHDEGDEHECECEECACGKKPINDTHPLWQKNPSDCTDQEYKDFYRKVFGDFRDPLFWIHINADYPLNFKGILYFPRINHEYESIEGQVKLYYNQVFVADNIKEVIPEYLLMLKGVLDCPELPLNVSRSYLQNSGYVAKISGHITKKVSDKLNSLFNLDRSAYEKQWQDIKLFVEYGCLRDRKFYDRVKGSIIFQVTDGTFATLDEYLEKASEKHKDTVYYCSDKTVQAQYISMFNAAGIDVIVIDKMLDNQFISMLEQDRHIKFMRVDSDIADALKGDGEEFSSDKLADLFKKVSANEKLTVRFENLKDGETPAVLNISEQNRRFDEMMKMYSMGGNDVPEKMPVEATLILNSSSSLIRKLAEKAESGDDSAEKAASQLYTLALLTQRQLSADELKAFLHSSFGMLESTL